MKDREGAMLLLAQTMSASAGPLGTRHAQRELEERGHVLSESSVSRLLRDMDARGWTIPVEAKGRVLSPEGRRRAAEAVLARRASNSLLRPISNVDDLLDLLRARSAIESAIAADAARSPEENSLDALGLICRRHADLVGTAPMNEQPGLQFHRSMVEMSTNRMLKGAAGMLLGPHFDHIESVLDSILATRRDEERVVIEHERILDRLRERDPAGAEAAVKAHFEAMIAATELSIVGGNAVLVQRLLELAR